MEIYKFDKCLLDRLEESMLVLGREEEECIPPSQVREQWSCYIELQIEPAGWQAIWHIPRVICEALNLRYPTTVFGHVEQVLFRELRAVFVVEAVQDVDVNFLERHEVALEELWPTISQENSALNVEQTAECLDRLRFFYTHVWMPWDYDNDDDLNWVEKHLEARIRFCYNLRQGAINRSLAQHIRSLLNEARYLQQRREYLELGLSEDEADGENKLETTQITDLMRLHLRLSIIRNEIEIMENPELRRIYEIVHFGNDDSKKSKQNQCFVVAQPSNVEHQIELLQKVSEKVEPNCCVQLSKDLLNALNNSKSNDMIFLSPGKHTLKFLEYPSLDGCMAGVKLDNVKMESIIRSPDDDSMLLVFKGNYTLDNLVFDCRNVRTGIMVKSGELVLRNCRLIGDGKSSTQQGIVCSINSKIKMENCIIESFASGIVLHKSAELVLDNSKIIDCKIGLESSTHSTNVKIIKTIFANARNCGIFVDNLNLEDAHTKQQTFKSFSELIKLTAWSGDCEFQHCKSNISVTNQKLSLVAEDSMCTIIDEDNNENGDESWPDCASPLSKSSKRSSFAIDQ